LFLTKINRKQEDQNLQKSSWLFQAWIKKKGDEKLKKRMIKVASTSKNRLITLIVKGHFAGGVNSM